MKLKLCFLISVLVIHVGSLNLAAQDQSETPINLGGFNTQGSATVGYRFTDIKGYQPMYLELYDLQKGVRLQDFSMFGEAPKGTNPFADSYSLTMSGLGGDPFPTAQLNVSKNKVYDLRVNWSQAYFYWNQNDAVTLPLGMAGLTDNHNWATVRKFGSVDLTLHATNNLRFNFDYYRTTDSGATFTTMSPDFLGSPSYWGAFARANPYYLDAPIADNTNRFTGGIDYTHHSWTFHYNLGYQTFNQNMTMNNPFSGEPTINTIPSTAAQLLTNFSWSEFRQLTTPVSEFSYNGKPMDWMEMRGDYIYYRYSGPASFDQSFNGIGPTAKSGVNGPYAVSQSGRANVVEPDHVIDQGFTFYIKKWWDMNVDYRYSRFTTDAIGTFDSLFNAVTPNTGTGDTIWRDGLEDLDVNMVFTPLYNLTLQPGVRLLEANVESLTNGVANPALSLRTKTAWPEFSAYYQPNKMVSIRGDYHSFVNSASYTAMTPHTEVGGHLIFHFQPTTKLSFDNDLNIINSQLLDTGFHGTMHDNSSTLSYALDDRFSIFGGFTYDNELAEGNIQYIRGTPPLSGYLRDQALNHVWQGGFLAKPVKHFGIELTGNYDRTTGLGMNSGEAPAYGPLTWPLVTGTVYFDFPKAGRLSVNLQRTYYIEQIVTGNNFQANLLTISWTRTF
ncbi:MAG TPA: hypothetical protein VMX16_10310 [Terriglobia bacterium]|nr:hypothetical protein [Terriglobia bacterium]